MNSPFVRVIDRSPNRVDGFAAIGLGLFLYPLFCPTCRSTANVQASYASQSLRKEGRSTWICFDCREKKAPAIFHTPPHSHFICCTKQICLDCQGRGWFRR